MSNSDSIDWEAQWALHSPGYRDGYLNVDLGSKSLKLQPGPGFGDLSHPTTNLVLGFMPSLVKGKHVLDVGCGSGILSLAASAMGAASVCGIDIEAEALEHSRINSKLNGMEKKIRFMFPHEYVASKRKTPLVVLMNMIQSEQSVAWRSLEPIHGEVSMAVTSGILAADRAAYLKQVHQWGWTLVDERQDGEWICLHFTTEPLRSQRGG